MQDTGIQFSLKPFLSILYSNFPNFDQAGAFSYWVRRVQVKRLF